MPEGTVVVEISFVTKNRRLYTKWHFYRSFDRTCPYKDPTGTHKHTRTPAGLHQMYTVTAGTYKPRADTGSVWNAVFSASATPAKVTKQLNVRCVLEAILSTVTMEFRVSSTYTFLTCTVTVVFKIYYSSPIRSNNRFSSTLHIECPSANVSSELHSRTTSDQSKNGA